MKHGFESQVMNDEEILLLLDRIMFSRELYGKEMLAIELAIQRIKDNPKEITDDHT